MWTFDRTTAKVSGQDGFDSLAYSGHGDGINNPEMEAVKDVGPIPAGLYTIGLPMTYPRLGKHVMELTPAKDNQMFGRSGFFWHGPNIEHPDDYRASDGCIVSNLDARIRVTDSQDRTLKVV